MSLPYDKLNVSGSQIRLLNILSTEPNISCALGVIELTTQTKLNALSYAWGDPQITETIYVNGYPVQVTTNLASALKYAPRHLKQSKHAAGERLWVDAICINQTDDAEKSSQVAMMGRIYSQSGIVICWLGLPADSLFAAIDAMETVAYERYVHGTYTENQENRHRLVACIEQLQICLESIKGTDAFGDLRVVNESSMEVSLVGDVELHALANTLQLTTVVLYDLLHGSYGTELRTGQETLVGTFHNIKSWHDQLRSRTCKLDASLVRHSHRVGFLLALLSFRINKFRKIVQDYLLQVIYDEGYHNVFWLEYHTWLGEVKGVIGESHATPVQPLFELSYWGRIWIRQEIILAKHPVFVCGPRSFSIETLESFSAWVNWIQDPSNFELTKKAGFSRLAALAYQRISKLLHHIFTSRQDKGGTGCHWLGTNALRFNIWWESPDARATNPKDYYYGFLGLTNLKLTPDYSPNKTLGLISRDLMHEYLEASRDEPLSSRTLGGPLGLLMFAGIGYGWDADQDMPSWGPNFPGEALAKPSSRGKADAVISTDPRGFRNVFKTASEAKITGADMEVSVIILDYIDNIGPRVSDYGRTELLHPEGLPITWAFDFALRQRRYVSGGHPLTALHTLLEPTTESQNTLADMAAENCLEFVKFLTRFGRVRPDSKLSAKMAWARLCFVRDYLAQVPDPIDDVDADQFAKEEIFSETLRSKSKPYNHSIASTRKGYIGRFPPKIQGGDLICILKGLDQVAVIRQTGKHYQFVGTCFVVGMRQSKQIQSLVNLYSLNARRVTLR